MRKSDFIVVFSVNALLGLLLALDDFSAGGILGFFRVVLGLAYLLFVPGYALQAALFPRREHLGALDRLALAFGLSVAIMPVLGLTLDGPPGGIFLWQSFTFLTALTVVCGLAALYRRSRIPAGADKTDETELNLGVWWNAQGSVSRLLFALLPVSVVIGLGLSLYVLFAPVPSKQFTGFSLLNASGAAIHYPLDARAGQPFKLKVDVANHEGRASAYSVQAQMNGYALTATAPFTLANGQSISLDLALSASAPGDRQLLEILLLRDNQVYRRLYLWLNVKPLAIP